MLNEYNLQRGGSKLGNTLTIHLLCRIFRDSLHFLERESIKLANFKYTSFIPLSQCPVHEYTTKHDKNLAYPEMVPNGGCPIWMAAERIIKSGRDYHLASDKCTKTISTDPVLGQSSECSKTKTILE